MNKLWNYNKDKLKGDLDATSSGAKARLNKVRGNVRPPPGVDGNEPATGNNDRNESSSWSRGQDVADKYKQHSAAEREKDLWDDVPTGDFEFGSLEGDTGGNSGGFDLSDFAAAAEKFRSDTKNLGVDKADHPMERYDASTDETMEELRHGPGNMSSHNVSAIEDKKVIGSVPSVASGAMRSKLLQVSVEVLYIDWFVRKFFNIDIKY